MQRQTAKANCLAATLLVAIFAITLSPLSPATEQPETPPPAVTVIGEGSVTAQPDRAALQLGMQARHENLEAARADVTRRSNAVLAHLASLDLEERYINATHISVQPEYRWDKQREEQILTGYSVQRSIDLALQDLSLLPDIIEGSADAGANRISPPRLSHSNEAVLRRDALRLATADARANADAIAETLGYRLGDVRDINSVGGPRPAPVGGDMLMRASMESSGGAKASYVTADMVFEARVNATFHLYSGR